LGVGELGVSLDEFYSMTWLEWFYYSEGIRKTQLKQWEHTRAINWMLYKINTDPKKAKKDVSTWWPLPTDNKKPIKKVGKRITKKEFQEFLKRMR